MTYHTKIARSRKSRSGTGLMVSGAATINIDQSLRLVRKQISEGSPKEDWKAVGRDIAKAISELKREFETV